jgi:hypothetical protein
MTIQADASLGFCAVCGAKRLVAGQDHCATCGAKLLPPTRETPGPVAAAAAPPMPAVPLPPAGWAQQPQPVYVVGQLPTSPALQMAAGRYIQRRYRQIASTGAGVTLERRPEFHLTMAFLLLFLFGVGALVYAVVYFIQLRANTQRVELFLRPDGQVEEAGYTLHELDRDTLVVARRWRLFWMVVLGLTAALFLLTGISELVTPASVGKQAMDIGSVIAIVGIAAVAFAGAWYLWRRAARIGRELTAGYPSPH